MLDNLKWPNPGKISLQELLEVHSFIVESGIPVIYCQSPTGDTFGFFLKSKRTWQYMTTLAEVLSEDISPELKTILSNEETREKFFAGNHTQSREEDAQTALYQAGVAGALAIWGGQKTEVMLGLREAFPQWEWDPTTAQGINRAFHFQVRIAPGDPTYPLRMTLSKRTLAKDRPRPWKTTNQFSYTRDVSLHEPILESCLAFLGGFQEIADLLREDQT